MNRVASTNRSVVLRTYRILALIACLIVFTGTAHAAGFVPPSDGWARWEVSAVEDAPNWCCFEWLGDDVRNGHCKLDRDNGGYGSRSQDDTVETMRVYARFEDGELQRIRALGPACPAEADSAIADLGSVSSDASARWLIAQIDDDQERASEVLAVVATHAGHVAHDGVVSIARYGQQRETRKNAVFWLGQLRAADSADELKAIMFDDADPEIRQHAAFSLAQSNLSDRATELIRLGRTDREPEVRGQAWFWLAQTGAPESEAAIADALSTEKDAEVRDRAIFALSQLPDERAVDALGAIVMDANRSREDRKRALFWLGQSDSPRAQTYLADILGDS